MSIAAGRWTALADRRGVTLLETVAAVAIVGVGLVGLAVVVPVASHGVQAGGQLSTATFLAEQMIERARAARWSADPAIDCLGVSTGDTPPLPAEAACDGIRVTRFPDETGGVSGHPEYRRVVRVTGCEVTPGCAGVTDSGMRRVTVRVTYGPPARTVQVEWLASRR